jgi:hypothetical protein
VAVGLDVERDLVLGDVLPWPERPAADSLNTIEALGSFQAMSWPASIRIPSALK